MHIGLLLLYIWLIPFPDFCFHTKKKLILGLEHFRLYMSNICCLSNFFFFFFVSPFFFGVFRRYYSATCCYRAYCFFFFFFFFFSLYICTLTISRALSGPSHDFLLHTSLCLDLCSFVHTNYPNCLSLYMSCHSSSLLDVSSICLSLRGVDDMEVATHMNCWILSSDSKYNF